MRDCLKKGEKNVKYKKGNRFYPIRRWDYKKKLDPNPHTIHIFDVNPRLGDARLVTILILRLILPPQKA